MAGENILSTELKEIKAALMGIIAPDSDNDIVTLGRVSGISRLGGHVTFVVEGDPAAAWEACRREAEQAVRQIAGVERVTAVLAAHHVAPSGVGRVRSIIAVASGKGGVGKSTVAANLAAAFAAAGAKTGLLDLDIHGPSVPRLLGIDEPLIREEDGKTIRPIMWNEICVMSLGFIVPDDQPVIWRGPMLQSAVRQMVEDVAWGALDVLVIDMPPGTGDVALTLTQRVQLSGAVIVSTPQDLALLDAIKALRMFKKMDVPVLGIIENMSVFCCPNCGSEAAIFGQGGARREAERLGVPFLAELPLDTRLRSSSDEGTPLVTAEPDGRIAMLFKGIAAALWAELKA